jgi:hypothetical protein
MTWRLKVQGVVIAILILVVLALASGASWTDSLYGQSWTDATADVFGW